MKNVSILGSTGSVGTQTLDVIERLSNKFRITGLAAHTNVNIILNQIKKFKPKVATLFVSEYAEQLRKKVNALNLKTEIYSGSEGLKLIASLDDNDVIVNSLVGSIGIEPTVEAIKAGKDVALANKETLVVAGEIIMREVEKNGVNLLPIDSEHSAIFQCLSAGKNKEISKIILTASGGSFRNYSKNQLEEVTVLQTLNHPTWKMGKKISVDSATLMNKGFEVIEAHWLFNISYNNIDIVVHPQSTVHSMVEFVDGSVIAQLGIHDMRIPIQYALTYPERLSNSLTKLDLIKEKELTFKKPDTELFPCLNYAYDAGKIGGTMPAVISAADEVAVESFLMGKIKFIQIPRTIQAIMKKHNVIKNPNLKELLESDRWARMESQKLLKD